ncbi:TonB-dependent siderophore receptor [Acetobacter orleanensis NRIC 0473]|nr:TonB-dependent receptor [Acetobacter orleanensis]GBR28385.1 TonB-dependent siderophore receptor [Acetobacter orleanensis NRIC 0473]
MRLREKINYKYYLPVGVLTYGAIMVVPASATDTPEIITVRSQLPSEVSDYRIISTTLDLFRGNSKIDAPYSIDAVPESLARNQTLLSVQEAFRFIPSVQGENIRPQSRGMQAGVVQNTFINGLNIAATTDYPMEQFERVEVLNGPSGGLFGAASPAGTFNYVLKRPTEKPLNRVRAEYLSHDDWMGHIDLGGHFDTQHHFGYRLNLVEQDGGYYVKNSQLKRELSSLDLDFHLTAKTTLEVDTSAYHYIDKGLPGTFSLAKDVIFPSAPSPSRRGYGQPYAGDNNLTVLTQGRITHRFNSDWTVIAGILHETNDRASTAVTNTLLDNSGHYHTTAANTTYSLDAVLSNNVYLNGHVKTGFLTHDVVVGTAGFSWDRYTPYKTGAISLGTASLSNPVEFAEPDFPDFGNRYRSVHTFQQALTFGDKISFARHWSVQAVATQTWIDTKNYNKTSARTAHYKADGIGPTVSLVYQPVKNMSAYFTYANSLQQGDNAPAGAANAGESLAPYRSQQWELGYKVQFGRVDLRTALYQLERPYPYIDANNVFAVQGNQKNRGFEVMASTVIARSLTLFGGIAVLDPRLHNTASASTNGRKVLGLAPVTLNALAEYNFPFFRPLTLTADVNFSARRPGNYTNTMYAAGYLIGNVGVRYTRPVWGRNMTWVLNVRNVCNAHYWANITPSSQSGYNSTGSGTGTLGTPRMVRLSVQMDL